jgi:hypothetical protein
MPASAPPPPAAKTSATSRLNIARFHASFDLVGTGWPVTEVTADTEFVTRLAAAEVMLIRWNEREAMNPRSCAERARAKGMLSPIAMDRRDPQAELALGTATAVRDDGSQLESWAFLDGRMLKHKFAPTAGHVVLVVARGHVCARAWYTERIGVIGGGAEPHANSTDGVVGDRLAEQQALWLQTFAFGAFDTESVPAAATMPRR